MAHVRNSRGMALWLASLALALIVCLGWSGTAHARRVALIIGNGAYEFGPPLDNPVPDTGLIAQAAREAGFEVTVRTDLNRASFEETLRRFRDQANGAEVALIYYAGHGIENADTNWLIPIDAHLRDTRDLRAEAVDLDYVVETLEGAALPMVVVSACRDNPLGELPEDGAHAVKRGLAAARPRRALVIFAAAPGQVAIDGTDGHSPFARAVARRLPEPGLSIHRLGAMVRGDVMAATEGKQMPWTSSRIDGREFYLVQPVRGATAQSAAPLQTAAPAP